MDYEVLFYDERVDPPAYYWVGNIQGNDPNATLLENLDLVTRQVREALFIGDHEISDQRLHKTIYLLRTNGLVSVWNASKSQRRQQLRKRTLA